jgi:hypothetical protein
MQPAGRLFVTPDIQEFCALYTIFGQMNIVYRCSYFIASGILMLHQSVMKYSRVTPNSRDGFCLAHTAMVGILASEPVRLQAALSPPPFHV